MMKPKYLWPVLLGLAAGCGGGGVTDGGEGAGESTAATEGSAEGGSEGAESSASSEAAGATTEAAKEAVTPPAPAVERPEATDFELNDLSGNPVTLSGLKGQVVLLAFWGID